jgi:DNA-binding transcriptional regulator GbsR (MarR family)
MNSFQKTIATMKTDPKRIWMANEIAKITGNSPSTVRVALNKLERSRDVKRFPQHFKRESTFQISATNHAVVKADGWLLTEKGAS